MPLRYYRDKLTLAVKIPVAAESNGGLDVRRHFGEVHLAVVGFKDFQHPVAGGVDALIILPETSEHLDDESARAAGHVGHADFGQLRHEGFGAGEIALLAADGVADFIHQFSGQGVDHGFRHRAGDACGSVVNAFVLAVGREKHFVALAEDVLVNAPVVVVDNAPAESLVPTIDAENKIELEAEALEIGPVLVQPVPNARGKDFRVVVVVKEKFKLMQELRHDAVRALGLPSARLPDVFLLGEVKRHEAVILHRAGKNEFVDDENDGFGGLFLRRPFDRVELIEPDF